MTDQTTQTTQQGRYFERPVRPTQCEGLPIVAWRCCCDYGGDYKTSVEFFDAELDKLADFEDANFDEVAAMVLATDVAYKLETLRRLIANDAHACTFQSLGQYRSALLAALSNTEAQGR